MDYLDLNKQLKQEISCLLKESGTIHHLESSGELTFFGAYAMDVMAHREVDMRLFMNPLTARRAYRLLADVDDKLCLAEGFWMNQLDYPRRRGGAGPSFRFDLRTKPAGDPCRWKLDLICHEPDYEEPALARRIASELNDDRRRTIIEIKSRFHRHPCYGRDAWTRRTSPYSFSSMDVYSAVIDFGVSSFPEFSDHMFKKHGIRIEDGLPENDVSAIRQAT